MNVVFRSLKLRMRRRTAIILCGVLLATQLGLNLHLYEHPAHAEEIDCEWCECAAGFDTGNVERGRVARTPCSAGHPVKALPIANTLPERTYSRWPQAPPRPLV